MSDRKCDIKSGDLVYAMGWRAIVLEPVYTNPVTGMDCVLVWSRTSEVRVCIPPDRIELVARKGCFDLRSKEKFALMGFLGTKGERS